MRLLHRDYNEPLTATEANTLVIDLMSDDPHAVAAAEAYAKSIEQERPLIADYIRTIRKKGPRE